MLWIMLLVAVGCLCLGVVDLSGRFESKQPRCTNYYTFMIAKSLMT